MGFENLSNTYLLTEIIMTSESKPLIKLRVFL